MMLRNCRKKYGVLSLKHLLFFPLAGREASRIRKSPNCSTKKIRRKSSRTYVKSDTAVSERFTMRATPSRVRLWPSRRCPTWANSALRNGQIFWRRSGSCACSNIRTRSSIGAVICVTIQPGWVDIWLCKALVKHAGDVCSLFPNPSLGRNLSSSISV